ncbi:XRE family transcriptional regulator [Aeromicrobium sp.]|uniref:XRE family transcriptional regulator n=1 Tax=Aeromicrobium sp. TaxID=1871063 RepID=UPI002FC5E99E
MAGTASPITPSVLSWALLEDGRSLLDIASAAKVSPDQLAAWTKGETQPTVGQATALAKALNRPRAFFFLPQPPVDSALPTGFRHPPGGGDRTVGSRALVEARRAKRVQQAIASAAAGEDDLDIPAASTSTNPATAAKAAREWLKAPAPGSFKNDYDALHYWRAALENRGVLVFALQLGADEVRGFAGWDAKAPMIVMNVSSVSPAARCFTIWHELGHLLLREATACLEPAGKLAIDNDTERWCEAFAAAGLMPQDLVLQWLEEVGVDAGEGGIETVRRMMRWFGVSGRAAAIRLEGLGYAEPGLYGSVQALFKPKPQGNSSKGFSPPRHKKRILEYGENALTTILDSLPESDALSVLRITVADARSIAAEVPGVRSF